MIEVKKTYKKIIPTDDGNVFTGETIDITIRVERYSDIEKEIDKILDEGLWVETIE